MMIATQDNTRTQEQTTTTGTSHSCISGNGIEPMREGNTDVCSGAYEQFGSNKIVHMVDIKQCTTSLEPNIPNS